MISGRVPLQRLSLEEVAAVHDDGTVGVEGVTLTVPRGALVLRRPDGRTAVAHRGTPVVTVTGEPSELLLFAFGRQRVARVELEGDQDAVTAMRETKQLGL